MLNRIRGGQVFITCCENDRLDTMLRGPRVPYPERGGAVMAYLHIGQNVMLEDKRIIGIFDLDNTSTV